MNQPLSRRGFLTVSASLTGGALLVGCSPMDAMSWGASNDFGAFGPFLKFAADGTVTVISKHIEFGQGNHAGLAAIAAEELGADWTKVTVEQAAANTKVYGNALVGGAQGTGGSSAISSSWTIMRNAGAAARAMFIEAAAKTWDVPAGEVTLVDGVIAHPSGKSAGFGDLLDAAAKVTPPAAPKLKDPKTFTLIGTDRVRRKDSVAKSTGVARYTQDVRLPKMLTAMVAHAPRFGGTVKSFDDTAARKVPGVTDVFKIKSGVAVVATSTWAARQGREALKVEWDESKAETRSSSAIAQQYRDLASGKLEAPEKTGWAVFQSKGSPSPAKAGSPLSEKPQPLAVSAYYDFPYLAHATMEPMNCVAIVKGNNAHLLFGSQIPTVDQLNTAGIVGNLPGAIKIDTLFAGGSFGRRANFQSDYVTECVRIAKKVGKGTPVKLVWTREDDMRAGYYRPMAHHALRVTLGPDGMPIIWEHRIVAGSIMKGAPSLAGPKPKYDNSATEGTEDSPYLKATAVVDAQVITPDAGVPLLWWRSVGATHNAYVMEHTVDQLAKAAGRDPVEYRRALFAKAKATRHLAVLDLAMEKAGPQPAAGWTRGVAVHESFGSVVAQVAEVKLESGVPKVGRVVTAIDCGTAISPDQIAAQMEGGTCYGLSAALFGAITLTEGRVDQGNFDTYRVLRNSEAPTVETYIVPSTAAPSGVGEPGTPVIGPAVANAILAITGKPVLSQPFVKA